MPQYPLPSYNCSFYTSNKYVPSDLIFSFTYCVLSCEIPLSLGTLLGPHQGKGGGIMKPKVSLTDRSDLKPLCLWWFLSFLANCSVLWAAILLIKIPWWWIYCVLNWSSSFPWQCCPSWMVCYHRLKRSVRVQVARLAASSGVWTWAVGTWITMLFSQCRANNQPLTLSPHPAQPEVLLSFLRSLPGRRMRAF